MLLIELIYCSGGEDGWVGCQGGGLRIVYKGAAAAVGGNVTWCRWTTEQVGGGG